MYEGQPIICKDIIEANWLEYLAFTKAQSIKEEERSKKVQEALKDINSPSSDNLAEGYIGHHYYDIGINGFWNWYIETKVEV